MARLDNGAVNSFCRQTDIRISVFIGCGICSKGTNGLILLLCASRRNLRCHRAAGCLNFGIKVLCSQSLCDIIDQLFLINGKAILLSRENELPCFCIKAVDGTIFCLLIPLRRAGCCLRFDLLF